MASMPPSARPPLRAPSTNAAGAVPMASAPGGPGAIHVRAQLPPPVPHAARESSSGSVAGFAPGGMTPSTPITTPTPGGSPGLQPPKHVQLSLERVLGLTSHSCASVCVNHVQGDVIFAAGCVAVAYNIKRNKQMNFYTASGPVTALAISSDGELLCAGTRSRTQGQAGALIVWHAASGAVRAVVEAAHAQGVAAVAFSPDGRFLVSVGYRADKALHVWAVPPPGPRALMHKIATGKLSQKVHAVAFSPTGAFFATAGERHLKFWGTEALSGGLASVGPGAPCTTLTSKPAIMSEAGPEFDCFVGVCVGPGTSSLRTYAITSGGMLCAFDEERLMEQWVHVRVRHGCALDCVGDTLLVGCSDGIVRVFAAPSLSFCGTLPLPPALGRHDVFVGDEIPAPVTGDIVPAALAVRGAAGGQYAVVVYGDRSLFVWDITDLRHVVKFRSQLHHAGPVWDLQLLPQPSSVAPDAPPSGTFVTCSTDCTLKFWNLNPRATVARREMGITGAPGSARPSTAGSEMNVSSVSDLTRVSESPMTSPTDAPLPGAKPRNLYMRELLQTIYVEDATAEVVVAERSTSSAARSIITGVVDAEVGFHTGSSLMEVGVRCVAVDPSCTEIACGDRQGNVRVYDIASRNLVHFEVAHDSEVVAMQYCPGTGRLLATGSRDRLVHVFDSKAGRRYDVVTSLAEHSSSVTALRFSRDDLYLITAAHDASVVFSRVAFDGRAPLEAPSGVPTGVSVTRLKAVTAAHGVVHDMDVDSMNKNLVTVGQDKRVSVWVLRTGKLMRTLAQEVDAKELVRVAFDPAGLFVATASAERSVQLFDFVSGSCVAKVTTHSDMVTAVRFSHDGRRLLTCGVDGCVFVWRLGPTLTRSISERLREVERVRTASALALTPAADAMTPDVSTVLARDAVPATGPVARAPTPEAVPPPVDLRRQVTPSEPSAPATQPGTTVAAHVIDARRQGIAATRAPVVPALPAPAAARDVPAVDVHPPAVGVAPSSPPRATTVVPSLQEATSPVLQRTAPRTLDTDALDASVDVVRLSQVPDATQQSSAGLVPATSLLDLELRQSILPAWAVASASAVQPAAAPAVALGAEAVAPISSARPSSRWGRPAAAASSLFPLAPIAENSHVDAATETTHITALDAMTAFAADVVQPPEHVHIPDTCSDAGPVDAASMHEEDADDVMDPPVVLIAAAPVDSDVTSFSVTSRDPLKALPIVPAESDADATDVPPDAVVSEVASVATAESVPPVAPEPLTGMMRRSLSLQYHRRAVQQSETPNEARQPSLHIAAPAATAVAPTPAIAPPPPGASDMRVGPNASRLGASVQAKLRGAPAAAPSPSLALVMDTPAPTADRPTPSDDLLSESLDLAQLIERARRAAEHEAATAAHLADASHHSGGTHTHATSATRIQSPPRPAHPPTSAPAPGSSTLTEVSADAVSAAMRALSEATRTVVSLRAALEGGHAHADRAAPNDAAELLVRLRGAMFAAAAQLTMTPPAS